MAETMDKRKRSGAGKGDTECNDARTRAMLALAVTAILGIVGIVVYASQYGASDFLSVGATSLVVACASSLAGAMLGFLFAIPRRPRMESQSSGPSVAEAGTGGQPPTQGVRANTNLDDISDWLTKILVGVGLTQLGAIGAGLTGLGNTLTPALGDSASSGVFGIALVIVFTLVGFLGGYLWTALALPKAFQHAESEVVEELQEVKAQLDRVRGQLTDTKTRQTLAFKQLEGNPEIPVEVVQQVAGALSPAREDTRRFMEKKSEEYDRIRADMSPGDQRRTKMSRIVADVGGAVQADELPPEVLRDLASRGEGGRVVALAALGASPNPSLIDVVIDGITDSRSRFEQYQALRAAEALVPLLTEADRRQVEGAVLDQMNPDSGSYLGSNTDRRALANRVLGLCKGTDGQGGRDLAIATPLHPSEADFGAIDAGKESHPRDFTLTNRTAGSVEVTRVAVEGDPGFHVARSSPNGGKRWWTGHRVRIPPGEELSIRTYWKPPHRVKEDHVYRAMLVVSETNGGEAPTATLAGQALLGDRP